MLGTATLAAPLMGWAGSVCDAAATLKTRTSASYTPNPTRTAQLAARAEQLAKIRRLAIRSYT